MDHKAGDAARLDMLAETLRGRRTIAMFEERPVDKDLLLAAVEVARWAPNHHVTEPWHFYILGDAAADSMVELTHTITAELRDEEVARRKAARWASIPGWVAVTCAVAEDELRQLEDYAACCCAIHNFALYLWEAGVGMKWSTGPITRDQRFYDLLGVDYARETIVALISLGYPKTVPTQRRRAASEIATLLP